MFRGHRLGMLMHRGDFSSLNEKTTKPQHWHGDNPDQNIDAKEQRGDKETDWIGHIKRERETSPCTEHREQDGIKYSQRGGSGEALGNSSRGN